jgi:superfamily II DNA/RNA helicase
MITKEQVLENMGIAQLNPMQVEALDSVLGKSHSLLLAATGSGKTLAFLLPLVQLLNPNSNQIQCLILAPTRELALQIESVWKSMRTPFKVNVCYGGHSVAVEKQNLSNPPAVLIGTPGRIADHLTRHSFDTRFIKTIIIDEFDKCLSMGFSDQMDYIMGQLSSIEKKVLVSATDSIEVPEYFQFSAPNTVNYLDQKVTESQLTTFLVPSTSKNKLDSLHQLLCQVEAGATIIFCNLRDEAETCYDYLADRGIVSAYYHGGMEQPDRERALIRFRNGSVNYLIATDLAARGLDIPLIKNVIHYQLPQREHEYIHRNGRTARMDAQGTGYVLSNEHGSLPEYLNPVPDIFVASVATKQPSKPIYTTIYVSGGKKNKINKIDIVGFFIQKGELLKDDVGMIEVKDFESFVAVKSDKIAAFLGKIANHKMKGSKYKIEVAR